MLRFKQYLQERAPAWTESLSTMLFDLPRGNLDDLKIPLSPAIFKRIWPKTIRSRVFHLTDYEGVEKLSKMQGKKKSISAFYNIESDRIDYGIQTEGGYVLELDADVLVAAPDDIASQPDKTGRRWLTWDSILEELEGKRKIKKMEKDLSELLNQLISTYMPIPETGWKDIKKKSGSDLAFAWENLRSELYSDKKGMRNIIRDYIDGVEKIMKKYSKPLKSIFTDYAKKRTREMDTDDHNTGWDEIVVNNFQIKTVHVGETYSDEDWTKEDFPAPYRIWTDNTALAKHISSIAKRGI